MRWIGSTTYKITHMNRFMSYIPLGNVSTKISFATRFFPHSVVACTDTWVDDDADADDDDAQLQDDGHVVVVVVHTVMVECDVDRTTTPMPTMHDPHSRVGLVAVPPSYEAESCDVVVDILREDDADEDDDDVVVVVVRIPRTGRSIRDLRRPVDLAAAAAML